MRLVSTFLFLALSGSLALAEDAKPADPKPEATKPEAAKPAQVPLRVVRVLPETHQALLFDKNRGTHVLAELGGSIDGFTVEGIDADEVTLATTAGAEIILAAPDRSWRHRHDQDATTPATAKTPEPKSTESQPVDPYTDPAVRVVEAPSEEVVRTVEAPDAATATPVPVAVPVVAAPVPAAPVAAAPVAAAAVATPVAAAPVAAATVAATPDAPDAPAIDAATILPRADLTSALSNFAKLTSSLRGAFTPAGVRVDSVIPESIFAKAGLRAQDTIVSVDNQQLHSIDDAASLYARASTTRNVSIQVLRAGKPLTLRVVIQ